MQTREYIRCVACACVTVTVLAGGHASAQQATTAAQQPGAVGPLGPEPDRFTVTPFLGAGFGGDLENTPAEPGLALGYGANRWISLEAEFGFAPSGTQGAVLQFDTSVWTLSGDVLYHFLRPDFTPYVALGLGVVGSNPDVDVSEFLNSDEDSTTTFAWNYGAGLKAALSDRIGLRGDLRYFNARDVAPDHWRIYGGLIIRRLGR